MIRLRITRKDAQQFHVSSPDGVMSGSDASSPSQTLPGLSGVPREIIRLGLPVLAEQSLVFCVGFFDVYLSGRLSAEATSAIGVAAYVSWLATMMSGLVGTGVAAMVARECGAGAYREANAIVARGLVLAAGLGSLLFGLLWTGAPFFVGLIGMTGPTREIAIEFLRLDAFGQLFACSTLVASAALRGSGDMRTPLAVLGVTNIVNVLVSTGCVFGWGPFPQLGVTGIVIGTITAHLCGFLLMMMALGSSCGRLQLHLDDVGFHAGTTWRILRIGGPAALDGAVTFLGHYLFLMIIARLSGGGFQGATFAAHMVGVRAEAIAYLPAVAWGAASASLAGRYLGAGRADLAWQVGNLAARQFLVYSVIISLVMWLAAEPIYRFMHADPMVAEIGVPAFRWLALYQIPTTMLIVYSSTLRGCGDTRFPLLCAVVSILGVRVPVAWLGGIVLDAGLVGAWWGMGSDNTLRMVLTFWRYQAGHWLRTRV